MPNRPRTPRTPAAPPYSAFDLATIRVFADLFDMASECGRPPCRRADACRARNAPCLVEFRDTFRGLLVDLLDFWEPLQMPPGEAGEDDGEEDDGEPA